MLEDLTGKRYGHLVVIALAERNPTYHGARNWKVLCDCGRESFAVTDILNGNHKVTCGLCHFHIEHLTSISRTHGKCHTKLYSVWTGMIYRCRNTKLKCYKNYGGRGISVCDEWTTSFESFESWAILSGYKEGLSIERIDNNSNYCPENCKWATFKEQSLNKRSNRLLTYNNETKTVVEWARSLKFKPMTLYVRLHYGWSVEDALSIPLGVRRPRRRGESWQSKSMQRTLPTLENSKTR